MSDAGPDVEAWRRFCVRLAALGEHLLDPAFPATPQDRAEGVHHLATQVSGWLAWATGYADADHPAWFRQNDTVMRWGGPNVDQTTRRARVVDTGTYLVSGRMNSCEDFTLTQKDGDMHEGRYGILREDTAASLGIREGDPFAILLAAEPPGTNPATDVTDTAPVWVPLQPGARMVNLREYYWDWRPLEPAVVTIERLDTAGTAAPRLGPGALAPMLDEAARLVEMSLDYWNEYVDIERRAGVTNTMAPARSAAGGSARIAYSFGFHDLADDEALILTADAPLSPWWDVQLYSLAWFESLDFAHRVTSLNHTQAEVSGDGRVRFVVSAGDPGVRNWLDTAGRRQGMITHRWIGGDPSPVAATVVPLSAVREHLPADTPAFSASQRLQQVRARASHVAWRYRT